MSPGELGSESAFDSAHPANRRVRIENAISHKVSWGFSEFEESKFILNLLESIERRVHRGQRLVNGALRFEMWCGALAQSLPQRATDDAETNSDNEQAEVDSFSHGHQGAYCHETHSSSHDHSHDCRSGGVYLAIVG